MNEHYIVGEDGISPAPPSRLPESQRRRRVVKGFAFRNHTEQEMNAVHHYLDTGEMDAAFPDAYRTLDGTL